MSSGFRFGRYLRGALVTGDFLVLNLAYVITVWIAQDHLVFSSRWVWLIANISFVIPELLFSDIHIKRIHFADKVVIDALRCTLVQIGVMLTLLYISDIFDVSVKAGFIFGFLLFFLLSLWWLTSRRVLKYIRRLGFNYRRVVIVGGGITGREVIQELMSDRGYGYKLFGIFDTSLDKISDITDVPKTGLLSDMPKFIRDNHIDVIYYTLDADNEELIRKIILVAEEVGAELVYVPKFHRILSGHFEPTSVGNLPALVNTTTPLMLRRNRVAKRLFDLSIAIPFLIVSPLIFIPIAIAIKAGSRGPVFFRQKRTGIHGTEFVCYKFRTMKVNTESDKKQATQDDPRKTKLGDFLRKSSIDELPQFYNVLLGNMSVVGPRPHMVSHTEEYSALIDKYMVRHSIKPGITGWAQVNGYRGGTKHLWQMERRVEYDVWYIRNWNIFLDMKIVLRTMLNAFRGEKNAY
ncbi:MAG: undecaprenyl-phosphate glucose phosphotransferase [Prevotella sp.]|nr:undecaprenyl-phosphate glucose phosphotransferase [Bacteroides sp.]MCM1365958.1 undecaprenyl-phosphate glucose phosphotransferase [Prevotella sp.]MCM1436621.1 undecaprenyl-phosphate glucose phosphotransferase [Prevotella sp.]